ncbi:polysaccharide biosynthesis protein [bacterium]|nr:polysaccharide biosynthesis protein [bacterium]
MKVCIFGGSGSFGTAMTKRILEKYDDEIVIFSRNEKLQFEHKQKFNSDRIQYIIGDIRDYDAVYKALDDVDTVILASAMKHIDKCESNPLECKKTNIDGCINVINASIERKVKKLIFLSTDKATNPITIYGCSKSFIEMYCQHIDSKDTEIIRTRYGNVFGSNGSVVWLFDKLAREEKPLTITNPNMTRFFMSLNQAVDLVEFALLVGKNGDLFVYNNKSCTLKELADLFSDNQVIIGNRCEEKNDEALLTTNELKHSELINNTYYRVNKDIINDKEYDKPFQSDNADRLTKEELQELLDNWREYENCSI